MKILKTLSACLAALFLLCSCEKPDEAANRIYVGASSKLVGAIDAANMANYPAALDMCMDARADIAKILEDYPGTRIALEVVKDAATHVGPYTYSELVKSAIPRLEALSEREMRPASLPWAVALAQVDAARRDEALSKLAVLLVYYDSQRQKLADSGFPVKAGFSDEQLGMMTNLCLARIAQPAFKNSVQTIKNARIKNANEEFKREFAKKRAQLAEDVEAPRRAPAPKIADPARFLADAKNDASLISYDLSAAKRLRERSGAARALEGERADAYREVMKRAFVSAAKITEPRMRQQALADVSAAASNAGLNNAALEILGEIKDDALAEEIVYVVADNLADGSDYVHAIAVVSRLRPGEKKDAFLFKTARFLAKDGMAEQARKIAEGFASPQMRSSCLIAIACANPSADSADLAASLRGIDPRHASADSVKALSDSFARVDAFYESAQGAHAARLAAVSGRLSADAGLSRAWNDAAKAALFGVPSAKDSAQLIRALVENSIRMNDADAAFDMIQKSAFRVADDGAMFATLCDAGLMLALSGSEAQARQVFEMAAVLCAANEKALAANGVQLAWSLQLAGFDPSASVEILKDFLPKF